MDALSHKASESQSEFFETPRIVVAGIGGAGCNTVNRLARMGIRGADLVAVNTDRKHLNIISESVKKVLIGPQLTKGLGAGGYPEVAHKAAEASRKDLEDIFNGTDLLFLAAGMGGGTGTGASPVVAEIARKSGAIVVAIVSYPFVLERNRLKTAEEGLNELRKSADTVVVIDNNRLVALVPNLPIDQAFAVADEITARAVRGITETITTPSLINIDYADVRAIMQGGGVAMIAVGEAKGQDRVREVVHNTLHQKLLEVDYQDASGLLLHLTGGPDMTLGDANEIGELISQNAAPNANVIWGARMDPAYSGRIEAIAIFTGIKSPYVVGRTTIDEHKKKQSWEINEL
ncbi:Cell division protein FtsZ 1 [uncultured archaeon]|nr:Cell division protein FtsZ 1 [uncultured archaeon]